MTKVPWYKNVIFYGVNVKAFRDAVAIGDGDFSGLIERLDYLAELGVICLWVLPFTLQAGVTTATTLPITSPSTRDWARTTAFGA